MSNDLETKLLNTQKELEALRADFNEFAYVVSHDLAAPFRQIIGFSEIIKERCGDKFDDKTSHHFDLILNGSKSGSRMIEALLSYSRLCTNKLGLTSADCNDIVENVLESLAPLIHDGNADIKSGNLPIVEADVNQLETLLHQLFHNALLNRRPGIPLVICLDHVENECDWEFCLTDNGIGIPENQQSKVFLVLRRGVTDKSPDRMGMGLAIAKRIVQNHGGNIWLDSNGHNGCSIYFSLPKNVIVT